MTMCSPSTREWPTITTAPHVHEYLAEFKADVLDHYDCFTIAEAPLVWPGQALTYIREDGGQLDMMIQFQCMCADCLFTDYLPTKFHLHKLKRAFSSWQYRLKGKAWNALYIENHDHPRIVSRYGSEQYWAESAKMLAVMYLFQQGTPFIYQGQEIGMTNWHPSDPEMYEDVQTRYNYAHSNRNKSPEQRLQAMWRSSRDSARTLMQWDSSENAGFTSGTPWFYVNDNYKQVNVAQQEGDPDSILNFYRRAVKLRKSLSCVRSGEYREHFRHSGKLYMYSMTDAWQKILVVCSFSDRETRFPIPRGFDLAAGRLILSNDPKKQENTLPPYGCKVYLWE